MGTVCVPPFANIFMNRIDIHLRELARNNTENNEDPIKLYKRFLDDIFLAWRVSVDELQIFLNEINTLQSSSNY